MAKRQEQGYATFSLDKVALGLLVSGPKHGYELYQDFVAAFGPIWKAGRSKFYAILSDLNVETLLSVTIQPQDDRPPRKIYHLTETGRQTFLDWVYEPVRPMRSIRVEFLAKLRFFYLLDLQNPYRLIDAQIAICQAELDRFASQGSENRPDDDPFYDLLSSFRQRQVALIIDWLNACKRKMIPAP
jgi:PadR family transcriptional regulator AphA